MAIGKNVVNALQEIIEHERGIRTNVRLSTVLVDEDIDIKAIRERLSLSQQRFADLYALPVATVQNWESGRRKPELAARLLLKVIAQSPEVVARAIREGQR
jgi:putative transcriptional regulator